MLNEVAVKSMQKVFERSLINFIFGKRLCSKCAKEEWFSIVDDWKIVVTPSVCEKCGYLGIVGYIDA